MVLVYKDGKSGPSLQIKCSKAWLTLAQWVPEHYLVFLRGTTLLLPLRAQKQESQQQHFSVRNIMYPRVVLGKPTLLRYATQNIARTQIDVLLYFGCMRPNYGMRPYCRPR